MQTIEQLLDQIRPDADRLGVHFRPPLPEPELRSLVAAVHRDWGVTVPEEYVRLLRVTNGIGTQRGYLADLRYIAEQMVDVWSMDFSAGVSQDGNFQIVATPSQRPRTPTYLWLGYDGNSAQQVYDFATGEYRQLVLGGADEPQNAVRSLVGLLRYMVYRDDKL